MKIKLLFLLFNILFINISAQDYIFGKVATEENIELPDVIVINIRTDERVTTNRDGHFMILARVGDELRFVKTGYERFNKRVSPENVSSPLNISLIRSVETIEEVEVKKSLTGDLKMDSKTVGSPKKVEKLRNEIDRYIVQKSDPRVLASKPGEFVQPKGQGFSIGSPKNKWDDVDLTNYLTESLGEEYFTDLQLDKAEINYFIRYALVGFERKKILKYGYLSNQDMMRFQRAVLSRIASYRAPKTKK
ncbi:hypothetical protein VUJ46_17890 [Chryseobacterium sp. MYb264]|uniref:hypothetical protein n=1 Tax=Chryseobacterium sp. MYb264 TaxID=2745153 RepID=UPI002E0DAAB6|nr:hypothetical protein VUJ46_17890 [Chryseobacterium sp. MYb264]